MSNSERARVQLKGVAEGLDQKVLGLWLGSQKAELAMTLDLLDPLELWWAMIPSGHQGVSLRPGLGLRRAELEMTLDPHQPLDFAWATIPSGH